jgi:hypothetical protein
MQQKLHSKGVTASNVLKKHSREDRIPSQLQKLPIKDILMQNSIMIRCCLSIIW